MGRSHVSSTARIITRQWRASPSRGGWHRFSALEDEEKRVKIILTSRYYRHPPEEVVPEGEDEVEPGVQQDVEGEEVAVHQRVARGHAARGLHHHQHHYDHHHHHHHHHHNIHNHHHLDNDEVQDKECQPHRQDHPLGVGQRQVDVGAESVLGVHSQDHLHHHYHHHHYHHQHYHHHYHLHHQQVAAEAEQGHAHVQADALPQRQGAEGSITPILGS